MSYAIQVERVAASTVDRRGQRREVEIFLHTVSPHHFAAETVADRLNDPETSFLPCEVDGRSELVRLSGLSYVEIPGLAPEIERLEEIGAARTRVELHLDCGEAVAGELVYEAPPAANRVSDLLNMRSPRFLLLSCDDRTLFVHRDAVDRVRL